MHPGAHCRHCGNWPRYGHIPLGNSPCMSESWRSVLVPPLLMGLSLLCKGPFKTLLGEVTISLLLSHACVLMPYFHTFLLFVCSAAQNHGLSLWKDWGICVERLIFMLRSKNKIRLLLQPCGPRKSNSCRYTHYFECIFPGINAALNI